MGRQVWAQAVGAATLGIILSACATSDDPSKPDALDQTRRGVADAAISPLRDIGLVRPDIPPVLQGLKYPYQATQLIAGCPQVLYEIGQLDAVLGKENYRPGVKPTILDRGIAGASDAAVGAAQNATDDLIPFRGLVRQVSGADSAERRYIRALELGHTRRTFLRGYGAALGCSGILPEPPPPSEEGPSRNANAPPPPPPAARDARSPR